jgi:YD repeat-containing protein
MRLASIIPPTVTKNGHLAGLSVARSDSVADTTRFAYDGLDRLSATTWPDSSAETLSYDADSNDAENRLTSASGPGIVPSYAYDAQGRRKSKTVNGATTIFVTDAGNREVLEYDGTTGVSRPTRRRQPLRRRWSR